MKTGQINILEPVAIPLMDKKREHRPLDYDHPHENDVLQQNIDILTQSTEGKRLYDTMTSYNARVRIISSIGSNGFALNSLQGFIAAPENIEAYSPYQVIAIAGVLRDMELKATGHQRPDPFEDRQEVLDTHINLNLDILHTICIIAEELETTGFPEVLKKFRQSGFEEFYSAYKNDGDNHDLARALAKIFDMEVIDT